MNYKTVLVTGSAGFIGFHISNKLLSEGFTVVGLDNLNEYYTPQLKKDRNAELEKFEKFTFYKGDITDKGILEKVFSQHSISKICHLAAQAGVRYSLINPDIYVKANVGGFVELLEAAQRYDIKDIVYASSSSVYGNNTMPQNGFSEQDDVSKPISVYGMTKRSNELTAYTYHHLYGFNITGLRFFTVYGPWGRPDMAYYKFTDAIYHGKTIDVYSRGNMKRDFTYIDDIVDGIYSALEKSFACEIINLGNSNTVPLMHFIACIEDAMGKKAKMNFLPSQPGDLQETFSNIEYARNKLGFSPKTPIKKGIKYFVDWYLAYNS